MSWFKMYWFRAPPWGEFPFFSNPDLSKDFPDLSPDLPFLALLEFLAFFLSNPFFPRDFRGRLRINNPCFFGGFPCRFQKKARKGRSGSFSSLGFPSPTRNSPERVRTQSGSFPKKVGNPPAYRVHTLRRSCNNTLLRRVLTLKTLNSLIKEIQVCLLN